MNFFHITEIDDVLFTGGIPTTPEHINSLKENGVSTIVSLEPLSPHLAAFAHEHGLKVVDLSVGWGAEVPQGKLKRFLSLAALAQVHGKKIFLHCLQGKDRTGQALFAYISAKYPTPKSRQKIIEKLRNTVFTIPIPQIVEAGMRERRQHYERTLERARRFPIRRPK